MIQTYKDNQNIRIVPTSPVVLSFYGEKERSKELEFFGVGWNGSVGVSIVTDIRPMSITYSEN